MTQTFKDLSSVAVGFLRHDLDESFTAPVSLNFFTNLLTLDLVTRFVLRYKLLKINQIKRVYSIIAM